MTFVNSPTSHFYYTHTFCTNSKFSHFLECMLCWPWFTRTLPTKGMGSHNRIEVSHESHLGSSLAITCEFFWANVMHTVMSASRSPLSLLHTESTTELIAGLSESSEEGSSLTAFTFLRLGFRGLALGVGVLLLPGAYEPPKAAKERVTTVPSKYKSPTSYPRWACN